MATSRQVVELARLARAEFALHFVRVGGDSLRIGDETNLSAAGVPSEMLRREGKWISGVCKAYVRADDANYGFE